VCAVKFVKAWLRRTSTPHQQIPANWFAERSRKD